MPARFSFCRGILLFALTAAVVTAAPARAADLTISSFAELIALQDQSDNVVTMQPGVYVINVDSKQDYPGGQWPAVSTGAWPGLLNFSGDNNVWNLDGVTFFVESTVYSDMPNLGHGFMVLLGGNGNVWNGFTWVEKPDLAGNYGRYLHMSGGVAMRATGQGHTFNGLTIRNRYAESYGFGSIYGKTGTSATIMEGTRLAKKGSLSVVDLVDSTFNDLTIDHSSFGHLLSFHNVVDNIVFNDVVAIAEGRSTDSLRSRGIAGADRNGVPFAVRYNGALLSGVSGQPTFAANFTEDKLDRCQNMDSANDRRGPIRSGYQYTLSENMFRVYGSSVGNVEINNAFVQGSRGGIVMDTALAGVRVDHMTIIESAGHGVPACDTAWNSANGGEGDAASFNPPSDSVITHAAADAAYSTALRLQDTAGATVDLEVLDPRFGYHRAPESTALALISGDRHRVRSWRRDGSALDEDLVVKVGEAGPTNKLLLCNLTLQSVTLSSDVTNSVVYSMGPVSDSGSGNTVLTLADMSEEPDACGLVATGETAPAPEDVLWDDKVFLAGSTQPNNTSNCGWFGCRVGTMTATQDLDLVHGGIEPQPFYVRTPVGSSPGQACVEWHDQIVIAQSSEAGNTPNCGMYGCRVATLNGTGDGISFVHGGADPTAFHVRPPAGEVASGCVQTGEEVILALSPEAGDTAECGWYGCEVAVFDGNDIVVGPGGADPTGIRLRSWEGTLGSWTGPTDPHEADRLRWTLDNGKLVLNTGACFHYLGNDEFALADCDTIPAGWQVTGDKQLSWESNPGNLEGGACFRHLGNDDWGFAGCSTGAITEWLTLRVASGRLVHGSNPWNLEGGACFSYRTGGELGLIPCNLAASPPPLNKCGLGAELALLVPALALLRRRFLHR